MTEPIAPAAGRTADDALFAEACAHARRVAVLASVEAVLGWDEQTMLPRAAGGHRAEQAAALAAIVHRLRTDAVQGERLHALAAGPLASSGSPEQQATIRLLARDFAKQSRLPSRLVEELARTGVEAQQAWMAARAGSSWKMLEPWLDRMFALKREQADCQRPDLDCYDALMDDYEPGGRWRDVATRFEPLRAAIVPLVHACRDSSKQPDDRVFTAATYPVDAQRKFVREVAARIGFDFDRGRLDTTEHPFCTTLGPDDCRITTRWNERSLPTALFGVLHEAGHGLYEQGLRRDWYGLPPGEAASLGIHESQSRLWENMVGRSAPFWEWCLPIARAAFPLPLADADVATVHEALLVVRPSFIRVEADEVTYNLHVMMRFDLERAVIQGDLAVADLPAAWNERFEKDFGMRPPDDAHGVLQDIHWSAGLIGYFPTYTLGNIYAAQLMAAARRRFSSLDDEFAGGRFQTLLTWLREEVHTAGRMLESDPLVERVTGSPVASDWLVQSLRDRYGAAHGL
ncbi:MAG: carboxypeptidase M32 [Planctomycetia bacterium]|nr:carboxypeptidase M32 [Planctomycetia bacterium]